MKQGSVALIVLALVAAVVLLAGGYFFMNQNQKPTSQPVQPTPFPTSAPQITSTPAPASNTEIDSKLKTLDSESVSVDQSLKDTPVDVMAE